MHAFIPRPRHGLSIIEVLIALVLVAVGILGIAGASTLALRTATANAFEQRAQRLAELRIAQLSARGCAGPASGADSSSSLREQWTLAAVANGAALLDESVSWTADGKARRLLLQTALLC